MTLSDGHASGDLAARLRRYREATRREATVPAEEAIAPPGRRVDADELANRLASAVGGEVIRRGGGRVVSVEVESRPIPIDRDRLARLPGQPPADAPLVCLDTETTGLATATGTVAFLIGLGWWAGDAFRQVQLLLPDHADEGALLEVLREHIPAGSWLVTYNGRGFDWPLLVTRYRMLRRAAPDHAGHLDLLPVVRRLFRHRLGDARLRTAEEGLLAIRRHGDVDGAEIPGRYLGFLHGGPVGPLVDVVRHNDQDVRSLARLLVLLEREYATPEARAGAPAGDLAGLARAFARIGQLGDALTCYDDALDRAEASLMPAPVSTMRTPTSAPDPWWAPGSPVDFGGRPRPAPAPAPRTDPRREAFARPWTTDRIAAERAHLLRRMGRTEAAVDAWLSLARGRDRVGIVAAVEIAKLREHRLHDPVGALRAALEGLSLAERRRRLGRPEHRLEDDLLRRARRLRRKAAAYPAGGTRGTRGSTAIVAQAART